MILSKLSQFNNEEAAPIATRIQKEDSYTNQVIDMTWQN
jgi:hypothetical protein